MSEVDLDEYGRKYLMSDIQYLEQKGRTGARQKWRIARNQVLVGWGGDLAVWVKVEAR